MDEIHVHKTKKSICAHFAESPCRLIKSVQLFITFSSHLFQKLFYNFLQDLKSTEDRDLLKDAKGC